MVLCNFKTKKAGGKAGSGQVRLRPARSLRVQCPPPCFPRRLTPQGLPPFPRVTAAPRAGRAACGGRHTSSAPPPSGRKGSPHRGGSCGSCGPGKGVSEAKGESLAWDGGLRMREFPGLATAGPTGRRSGAPSQETGREDPRRQWPPGGGAPGFGGSRGGGGPGVGDPEVEGDPWRESRSGGVDGPPDGAQAPGGRESGTPEVEGSRQGCLRAPRQLPSGQGAPRVGRTKLFVKFRKRSVSRARLRG